MISKIKNKAKELLLWSQKYTKTDMLYLAKGGFWLTLGQAVSSLSSLFLAIAFANFIPPDVYGLYRYILSIAGILAVTTLPGINTAVIQATTRGAEGTFSIGFKAKLQWGTLGTLASMCIAAYYYLHGNSTLTFSFIIIGVFMPLMHSFALYDSFLQGKKQFDLSARYSIITQVVSVIALLTALFATKNLLIIVLAYFISWTSLRWLFFSITSKQRPTDGPVDLKAIAYGKHLSLLSVLSTLASHLDQLLIFYFLGPVQVAIYSIAIAPVEQIRTLFRNIGSLSLPKLSVKNDLEIQYSVRQKLKLIFGLIVVLIIAYVLIAPHFFRIFFPKYETAVMFSRLAAFSFIGIASYLTVSGLTATRKVKELYTFSTSSSIAQIIAVVVLIPLFGLWGAILARIFSHLFNFLFSWYIVVEKHKQ